MAKPVVIGNNFDLRFLAKINTMAELTKFDSLQDLKLRGVTNSDEPLVIKRRHEEFQEFIALLRQNFVKQKNLQKSKPIISKQNGQQLD